MVRGHQTFRSRSLSPASLECCVLWSSLCPSIAAVCVSACQCFPAGPFVGLVGTFWSSTDYRLGLFFDSFSDLIRGGILPSPKFILPHSQISCFFFFSKITCVLGQRAVDSALYFLKSPPPVILEYYFVSLNFCISYIEKKPPSVSYLYFFLIFFHAMVTI